MKGRSCSRLGGGRREGPEPDEWAAHDPTSPHRNSKPIPSPSGVETQSASLSARGQGAMEQERAQRL